LRQGETLLIQPSSLLYRDVTVRMALHLEYPRNMGLSFWPSSWSYRSSGVRLWGPGRVAVQSVYEPAEDTEAIRRHSYATTHRWQPSSAGNPPAPGNSQRRAGVERGHVGQRGRPVGLVERGQFGRAQHLLDPLEAAGRARAHRLQQTVGRHVAARQHDGVDGFPAGGLVGGEALGRGAR